MPDESIRRRYGEGVYRLAAVLDAVSWATGVRPGHVAFLSLAALLAATGLSSVLLTRAASSRRPATASSALDMSAPPRSRPARGDSDDRPDRDRTLVIPSRIEREPAKAAEPVVEKTAPPEEAQAQPDETPAPEPEAEPAPDRQPPALQVPQAPTLQIMSGAFLPAAATLNKAVDNPAAMAVPAAGAGRPVAPPAPPPARPTRALARAERAQAVDPAGSPARGARGTSAGGSASAAAGASRYAAAGPAGQAGVADAPTITGPGSAAAAPSAALGTGSGSGGEPALTPFGH